MKTLESIKNRLVDMIMLTTNEELLIAIDTIFNSTQPNEILTLDSYQIEMLMTSEKDIERGDVITESELDKEDAEWME